MFTPSILTRLVRWGVWAFASCFLACTFAKEKPAVTNPSPSVKHSTGHIVSETKNNTGDKKISDKNRRQNNHNGAYDITIESNKSEESNQYERSSWLVNRKIGSTKDTERDELSSDEGRSNEDGSEGEANATKERGDGERGTTCCEVELASSGLKRLEEPRDPYQFDGSTGLASGSLRRLEESRDSYESDGSTGSFTFPVLEWDWIGSPVRMPMPTSEGITPSKNKAHCMPIPWKKGIRTKKNKTHFLFFQCFRF
ncbi:hypothetical protein J1N35_016348 [Gossypium stocksii]|uniref:Uncharacterized protein n=1 Tax=Gossypium stocksii TaxID=47602 RepID=A0A9D3VK12_9ROSI|nr:hypothetical protein J1N35_016348 [Gossypium stocksii]